MDAAKSNFATRKTEICSAQILIIPLGLLLEGEVGYKADAGCKVWQLVVDGAGEERDDQHVGYCGYSVGIGPVCAGVVFVRSDEEMHGDGCHQRQPRQAYADVPQKLCRLMGKPA